MDGWNKEYIIIQFHKLISYYWIFAAFIVIVIVIRGRIQKNASDGYLDPIVSEDLMLQRAFFQRTSVSTKSQGFCLGLSSYPI